MASTSTPLSLLLSPCFLLGVLAAGAAPASHPSRRPELPQQFTAVVGSSGLFDYGAGGSTPKTTTIYYDALRKMQRQIAPPWNTTQMGLPGFLNQSTYEDAHSYFWIANDVCRNLTAITNTTFADMWAWVAFAQYEGKRAYYGLEVDVWRRYSAKENDTLFADGDTPVLVNKQSFESLPGQDPAWRNATTVFLNIRLGPPAEEQLALPEVCKKGSFTCNVTGDPVVLMDHYIAHPPGKYNVSDQDTADINGDTAFTCSDVRTNKTKEDHYGVVSHYKIAVDTRFGKYQLCNGYDPSVCFGGDDFRVGRESALGVKPYGGQCDDNSDLGSWFSFPAKGRCKSREDLKAGGCTWFIEERVKTINYTCPFNTHGMLEACGVEGIPYEAREIFTNAFRFDDESKGGCKDLGGPPTSEIF